MGKLLKISLFLFMLVALATGPQMGGLVVRAEDDVRSERSDLDISRDDRGELWDDDSHEASKDRHLRDQDDDREHEREREDLRSDHQKREDHLELNETREQLREMDKEHDQTREQLREIEREQEHGRSGEHPDD
jgi:hypothetical protein